MSSSLLGEKDFQTAAQDLGCSVAAVRAVCEVEAPRGGFNPDGTPVTLFEGHKFHKYTAGRFSISHPSLSYASWTKVHYGKSWRQEQERLERAKELDHDAALMSASWGKFQIMGFNYEAAGFSNVRDFVAAMYESERAHLLAFVQFVRKNGLAVFLRNHDWAGFARGYNGAAYAENKYDLKIAAAFENFSRTTAEAVVETIQISPLKAPSILNVILGIIRSIVSALGKKPNS